jgi:hypothetical protein
MSNNDIFSVGITEGKTIEIMLDISVQLESGIYYPEKKEIEVVFKEQYFDNTIDDVKLEWQFAESGKDAVSISDDKSYDLKKGGRVYRIQNVDMPSVFSNLNLLDKVFRSGDIKILIKIPGCAETEISWAEDCAYAYDATVGLKGGAKRQVNIGDPVFFEITCSEPAVPQNAHKYLLIYEEDLTDPKLEDYKIRINGNVVEVRSKNNRTEPAALIEFNIINQPAEWTAGQSARHRRQNDNYTIIGNYEGGSPNVYEWSVILIVMPAALDKSDLKEFKALSEFRGYAIIKDPEELLRSPKPEILKPKVEKSDSIHTNRYNSYKVEVKINNVNNLLNKFPLRAELVRRSSSSNGYDKVGNDLRMDYNRRNNSYDIKIDLPKGFASYYLFFSLEFLGGAKYFNGLNELLKDNSYPRIKLVRESRPPELANGQKFAVTDLQQAAGFIIEL